MVEVEFIQAGKLSLKSYPIRPVAVLVRTQSQPRAAGKIRLNNSSFCFEGLLTTLRSSPQSEVNSVNMSADKAAIIVACQMRKRLLSDTAKSGMEIEALNYCPVAEAGAEFCETAASVVAQEVGRHSIATSEEILLMGIRECETDFRSQSVYCL